MDKGLAKSFLNTLFEYTENVIQLWALRHTDEHKQTFWVQDIDHIDDAINKISEHSNDHSLYYSPGLFTKRRKSNERGKEDVTAGLVGLFLDVDIINPEVHKKEKLAPDQETAIKLVKETLPPEFSPSIIVNSGHGIQALWLFKEPWIFEDANDRNQAKDLICKFIDGFKFKAIQEFDFTVDATKSLNQLLRLPGTKNVKIPEKPKDVTIIEQNDNRFEADEIAEYLPEGETKTFNLQDIDPETEKKKTNKANYYGNNPLKLKIVKGAQPPAMKLQSLLEMDTKFASSYRMLRDKELYDNSLSTYDMSLARLAKNYGWEDQEVCDLLISFREANAKSEKELKKTYRIDYMNMTIMNAKEGQQAYDEQNNLAEIVKEIHEEQEHQAPVSEKEKKDRRQRTLDGLSRGFKVGIQNIIKYTGDEPIYELILKQDNKRISLGPVQNLIEQGRFRKQLAAHCNIFLKRYKVQEWDVVASALLSVVEVVETGGDTRDREILRTWIRQYIAEKGLAEDHDAAIVYHKPIRLNGDVWIFSLDFRSTMATYGDKYTSHRIGYLMRSLGATPGKASLYNADGERRQKKGYKVTHLLTEEEIEQGLNPETQTTSEPG